MAVDLDTWAKAALREAFQTRVHTFGTYCSRYVTALRVSVAFLRGGAK